MPYALTVQESYTSIAQQRNIMFQRTNNEYHDLPADKQRHSFLHSMIFVLKEDSSFLQMNLL